MRGHCIWPTEHFGGLMKEFAQSVRREPLIPAGAPLDYVSKGRAGLKAIDLRKRTQENVH